MMLIVVLLAPTLALTQPLPLPKAGQCPSGYRVGQILLPDERAVTARGPEAGAMPVELGAERRLLHKNRIMIFGPKDDGTYVVEFRTAEGEALAISIPRSEAHVIRHFQERMPYGLFVPEVPSR